MNMPSPPGDPMFQYIRAVLGKHMAKMRDSGDSGDRGASAIELAIIRSLSFFHPLYFLVGVVFVVIGARDVADPLRRSTPRNRGRKSIF